MNSQTLWHELFAVATKHIQSEIESAKSSVDFFIASFYLSIFFGFACWVLAGIQDFKPSISALSIPAFALAGLCHSLAIRATDGLIYPVQALVNLGRVKLADNLGLRLPKTLEAEKTMWGLVTRYAYHADKSYGNDLDVYRKPFTEARAEERFVMCERWPRHLRCRRP
ncbi:hypothetical protein B1812_11265 [Methylocystis bryophila]|uniref:Uncharacterized protein n=2 Tax=Methylocystis bryophila TaxID=655015 RepID=A0A1W6MVD9_9HYPH|nr:hypothetical protein B1812_11265 [Methylocystis bryophila]